MAKFVVPIDETELAVRLVESACGMRRPAGMSAAAAWKHIEQTIRADDVEAFRRQARAAMEFFAEQVGNLRPVS